MLVYTPLCAKLTHSLLSFRGIPRRNSAFCCNARQKKLIKSETMLMTYHLSFTEVLPVKTNTSQVQLLSDASAAHSARRRSSRHESFACEINCELFILSCLAVRKARQEQQLC